MNSVAFQLFVPFADGEYEFTTAIVSCRMLFAERDGNQSVSMIVKRDSMERASFDLCC
jgi:hypothetical protein